MAVDVDSVTPLWCACHLISECEIRMKSLVTTPISFSKYGFDSIEYHVEELVCTRFDDMMSDLTTHDSALCVLLRACLIVALDVKGDAAANMSLCEYLQDTLGGGINVVSCARIPSGSGMGGSSILAAVAIKAIHGLLFSGQSLRDEDLVNMVLVTNAFTIM